MSKEKFLKECLVCGKKFMPCMTCRSDIDEQLQWRRVVCCPQHFSYHLPIIKFARGEISKEKAKSMLLEAFERFGGVVLTENCKRIADKIMS